MSGQFLQEVHSTCRRGPHLCPCSPHLQKSKLVERTTGVNRPLTCYRCQQGYTTSLEIGKQYQTLHNKMHCLSKKKDHAFLNQDLADFTTVAVSSL